MIEVGKTFTTADGKSASVISSKKVSGKIVFVGIVDGVRSYVHWNEDGTVWQSKDKSNNIMVSE